MSLHDPRLAGASRRAITQALAFGRANVEDLCFLETKEADGSRAADTAQPSRQEVKDAITLLMRTFEEFKAANDERIKQIETKTTDVVTTEKVDRVNDTLTKMQAKMDQLTAALNRPVQGGDTHREGERELDSRKQSVTAEQKKLLADYREWFRHGASSEYQAPAELRALSLGTDPQAGYTVIPEFDQAIDRIVSQVSPIRQLATVRQSSSASYKKLMSLGGAGSGWVGDTTARSETTAPSLAEIEVPVMEIYANIFATQSLLDDSFTNIEQWIAEEAQITFAEQEGAAFVNGNGVAKPRGFLQETAIADASYVWGKIGYVVTGTSANYHINNSPPDESDALISLIYAPKTAYLANANFVMNRVTLARTRKIKDLQGQYLWQPSLMAGQPSTLLGFPVTIAEDMPNYSTADAYAIAFGDFKRGYLIVDRVGIRTLRDPYTNKPYVGFYITKRVGGKVMNYEAIKLLKFGTS